MNFLYRLGYYLGGFSIGLILLFFILNGKRTQCNYGPQARVLDNMSKKNWTTMIELPSSIGIDSLGVQNILKTVQVNFNTSDTQRDSCKVYVLENFHQKINYELTIENCRKYVKIIAYKPLP